MNPSFEFKYKERISYLNQRIQASLEGSHFFPGGFSCSGVTVARGGVVLPQLERAAMETRAGQRATRRKEEEERLGRVVMMRLRRPRDSRRRLFSSA